MQAEQETAIQPRLVEIDDKIQVNIDVMAASCAEVFILRNDGTSVTDEIRQDVLNHFRDGIVTLTGLSPDDAVKLAKSKIAAVLSQRNSEQTIFAAVPDVNTGEITAIMQGDVESAERVPLAEKAKGFFMRAAELVRPS